MRDSGTLGFNSIFGLICKMEKDEFSRRWRQLKTPEDKRRFLADELKNELGSFDAFRGRLPTIRVWAPAYLEEYPHMRNNNLYAQLTEKAMFGGNAANNRNNQSFIVNKIVEEMTNIPALIESFNPSTSHLLKINENGSAKKPKPLNDHRPAKPEIISSKNNLPVENHRNHTISKPSTSDEQISKLKSNHIDQRASPHQKTNNKHHSPTNNKHKLNDSAELRVAKQKRVDSPQVFASTSIASIPKIELPFVSPMKRPTENLSRPSSRQANSNTYTRSDLFACKFPDYAIGEYFGYRIRKANDKSSSLPESVVSLNIRKIPNVKELMTHVKNLIKKASKLNQLKNSDLTTALYMSGLLLYALQKSTPSIINDLLREILAIISTIRSTYLDPASSYSQTKNFPIVSSMLYLVESHLCEQLYENTLEFACKRRELMSRCQSTFSKFDNNEELTPANFGSLLELKNSEMFDSVLSDLCTDDKVNIPKLYYQLLLESSQHSMLHEKHVYSKKLCIQQMETLEPALWKHLTTQMQLQLDTNSCTDIADAAFSIVYWMHSQEKA
ncbi:hypothetical protein M3Y97_00877900 [Aphelenchoides bicaudatus]|nr:hypothetical protein M3Y97_00877900 [Aphelenchoides bicaudatus]